MAASFLDGPVERNDANADPRTLFGCLEAMIRLDRCFVKGPSASFFTVGRSFSAVGTWAQMADEAEVRAALAAVEHPEIRLPITELGMVRGVRANSHRAQLSIALLSQGYPLREYLRERIVEAVQSLGVEHVAVDFTTLSDTDRRVLRQRLQEQIPPAECFTTTRVFAVASGKGGVGKSSLTVNLAVAMSRQGKRVAILDADVYGFSVPRMLGIDRTPLVIDSLLIPPEAEGVAVVSVGFFVDEGTPVIWRGPMLHKMLQQFVNDVWWGRPDVLLIDMPPGTGDVSLTLSELVPTAELVVVITPQPAAQRVAQRAAYMARRIKVHVAGVVENMSWFTGNDGERYELFGSGGGEMLAADLGVPLLGQVPLVPALREGGDLGTPIVVSDPDSEAAQALTAVATRLLDLRPAKIRRPELRILSTS
jgi:ATP-binding protein involved in chromosome partitioning